jgi:hypothetical protein
MRGFAHPRRCCRVRALPAFRVDGQWCIVVSDPQIPQEVQAFIADHIESVVQLEVLLLLHAAPQRVLSAADIGTELRIDPAWAGEQLVNLCSRGILTCTTTGESLYRYSPRTPEMDRAVAGLAQAYTDRRVTVIGLIFSKPVDKIRSFADAFRLRKD